MSGDRGQRMAYRFMSRRRFIGGSIAGFFLGLIAWLVTTSKLNGGVVNVVVSLTHRMSIILLI